MPRRISTRGIAELGDLFAQQLATVPFRERKMHIGMPAGALQMRGRHQRIATIVSFAGKDEAIPRMRKELLHCSCDTVAGLIHQLLCGNAARESRIFCVAHLRRGNDRRIHSTLELTVFSSVLEDFFFFAVLWRR